MRGRVLVVAGSDSGGGAGLQADIKTITMLGGYAATAVTAVTVQNTLTVSEIVPMRADIVAAQMRAVLDDLGADAIKLGMLGDSAVVRAVSLVLREMAGTIPIVLDPVMVSKGGARLLSDDARAALSEELLGLATVVTPNLPEAEVLTGLVIDSPETMELAAQRLFRLGVRGLYLKGGHLPGNEVRDRIGVASEPPLWIVRPRIESRHTHGTGCTLASALAVSLAQGFSLGEAATRAHHYVRRAIETAPQWGRGHGPLNHGWPLDELPRSSRS